MADDCTFCSILKGELPSYDVYETEDVLAFLDVNPVSRGHTLVVPKVHAATLTELDDEFTAALFTTVREVAAGLEDALDPDGINVLQSNGEAAGQEIPHVHVHVIPRKDGDGVSFSFEQGELDEEDVEEMLDDIDDALPDG